MEDNTSNLKAIRVLLLNPNSSRTMTLGMQRAIQDLYQPKLLDICTYTAPEISPASINNDIDLDKSTSVVLADITARPEIGDCDAILVACYSVHPLVTKLGELFTDSIVVTGIFESSILASLALLPPYSLNGHAPYAFGVVTTGKFWEDHLSDGVRRFLGQAVGSASSKFAGVFSTGLDAGDFHGGISEEVIYRKLKSAAKQLLSSTAVRCVVMGCAGMAGLEDIIREAAVEEYGADVGRRVCIIDGVRAGISLLEGTIKNKRSFQNQA